MLQTCSSRNKSHSTDMAAKSLLHVHPENFLSSMNEAVIFFSWRTGKEFSLKHFERITKNDHAWDSPCLFVVCN